MRNDIHDALLSVGEVAVFAFSLLELLFTRILPLGAFIAGHVLLHFWRLLASIVAAASGRRKPRGEYSYLPPEEELLRETFSAQHYEDVQGLEDHQLYGKSLNAHKLTDTKRIVSNDEADLLQGAMSATQVADVAAEIADHPHVADSVPSDAQIIFSGPSDRPAIDVEGATQVAEAAEELGDHLHVANLTPSDAKIIDVGASDLPANHADVSVVGEDEKDVSKSGSSKGQSTDGQTSEDQEHVSKSGSSKGQSIEGQTSEDQAHVSKSGSYEGESNTGLGSSDGRTSEETAETLVLSPSKKAEMLRRDASQTRSSRRRRAGHMHMRVLPPSFSEIKRSFMQRSRRSSPAQSNSPNKKQSPRSSKLASALRSSTSNANFMGKFRKHFLLDRT